ncbi:MAG: hypothetical protein P1P84_05635 [Deferrisomatales bacterium]|nr:hypothetical protein [Deferrisomatales bacterium]
MSFTDEGPNLPPEEQQQDEIEAQLAEFVRKQVEPSHWGSAESTSAYACYRAWCRRKVVKAVTRARLEQALRKIPGVTETKSADGVKHWEGLRCDWPT